MVKTKSVLVIILSLLIIFLCIDIFAGIWYWNRTYLIFNSTKFNNVSTPILTIISIIIYAFALNTTIKQNKIILSQNLKPFYEREIEKHYKKAKKIKIDSGFLYKENINALNYTNYIQKIFISLLNNDQFRYDFDEFISNSNFEKAYFEQRNYYNELLFLNYFSINMNPINFFYSDLKKIIEDINNSVLIVEDKILLKRQIERTFLSEYMELNRLLKKDSFFPKIPILISFTKNKIDYKSLGETDFAEHYNYFKLQFEKSAIT